MRPVLLGPAQIVREFDLGAKKRRWEEAEERNLASHRLAGPLRRAIGEATVHIYPWETLIAEANDLNWRPRPVFQSYLTYTPYLDGLNAEFFRRGRGAEFLVWHSSDMASIDGRYLLNDDPLTLEWIFREYAPVQGRGNVLLFRKRSTPLTAETRLLREQSVRWGDWVSVPAAEDGALRVGVQVTRSWAGELRRLAWKEGDTFVEYRFESGHVRSHRLPIANAASGVWVAPYVASGASFHREVSRGFARGAEERTPGSVSAIRFVAEAAWAYRAELELRWTQLELDGSR
jgi:hypothetical protein